jgi:phenylacetate-CoA ligase
MKKAELQQLQIRRLKTLLRHAYDNVPFYHESFRKSGFRPGDFTRLEDLRKVPVLQRSDLRLNSRELLARNVSKSELISCATSGTTAAPLRFYQGKKEVSWYMAAEARGYSWAGYETGAKLAYIRRITRDNVLARPYARIMRLLNRWKLLNLYGLTEKSMASFSLKMRRFKPEFILGPPAAMNIFAIFLLENNESWIRPKAIFTYGQTLLANYRRNIEKAFNSRIHDMYACTEIPDVACQCGEHCGLHVTDENVFVEIDNEGDIAVPGEEGRVLLTSLIGFAMPFIRYDVGDSGKILDDDCSCGRELTLLTPFGRKYEYFAHSDGSFTVLRDLQTVFEDLPIEDFQIVQQDYDDIVILIVKRPAYVQAHTDFILKNITMGISSTARIRVEFVDSLPLDGFGKVLHFVSKIATKYT